MIFKRNLQNKNKLNFKYSVIYKPSMKNFKIIPIHPQEETNDDGSNRKKHLTGLNIISKMDDDITKLYSPSVSPGTSPVSYGEFIPPPSPRTRRIQDNAVLYSLGRDGQVLTFVHSDYPDHRGHCINLRFENKYNVKPMVYSEYFHPSNKYCICMITDYARKNVKVMGFILYRKKYGENRMNILDVIFYSSPAVDEQFPGFSDINIAVECMRSFVKFVDDIGYSCTWRPGIKWKYKF